MAVLTISREMGSGGREIGQSVAARLGYFMLDKEAIHVELCKAGRRWGDWGKDFDEHCPTVWEKNDWSFLGYRALLERIILDKAVEDRAVIVGRGANFLLREITHVLRVRVICPVEKRIGTVMKREMLDREAARKVVERSDYQRACFIRSLYEEDWADPVGYDMVFDTGSMPLEEIETLLESALRDKKRQKTPEAEKILFMRALAARIKAIILTDDSFMVPTLQVFPEGETIVLQGIVHNPSEHKGIEARAREIAGPVSVICRLQYRI